LFGPALLSRIKGFAWAPTQCPPQQSLLHRPKFGHGRRTCSWSAAQRRERGMGQSAYCRPRPEQSCSYYHG
jgi:hypothetical protein